MAIETHVHDGTDWRKARSIYAIEDLGYGKYWRKLKRMYCHDGTEWRLVFGNGWTTESTPYNFEQIESINGVLYLVRGRDSGFNYTKEIYSFDGSNFSLFYSFPNGTNIKDICNHNGNLHVIAEVSYSFYGSVYKFESGTPSLIGYFAYANSISSVGGDLYLHNWSSSSYDVIYRYISGTSWSSGKRAGTIQTYKRGAIIDYQGFPYLCSSDGVYYDDGGSNLVRLGSLTFSCFCGHFSSGNGMYVATSDGIYLWNGSLWSKIANSVGGGFYQKSLLYDGNECFQNGDAVYFLKDGALVASVGGPQVYPYYALEYDMCIHNGDLWGASLNLFRCIGYIG